jgi:hypothetical protein
MSADFWQEGQRVWDRLARWCQHIADESGSGGAGDEALEALTDVGSVRRLLDRVEFEAIRTARRQGRSWAEIAVRLGITRQSAWERWQDVDESDGPRQETMPEANELTRRVARRHRRLATVVVPNVIGHRYDDAQEMLVRVGLVATGQDPDAPPLDVLTWPVIDQSPESGAMVPPGSAVRLWLDRGGGAGVREPRRPSPDPKRGRKMLDEITDEAI